MKEAQMESETPLLKRVRFTPQSIIAASLFVVFEPTCGPDRFARETEYIEHCVSEIMQFMFLPKVTEYKDLVSRFPSVAKGMRLLAETFPDGTDSETF
jgi:uncharacterized FlgJ-related protein